MGTAAVEGRDARGPDDDLWDARRAPTRRAIPARCRIVGKRVEARLGHDLRSRDRRARVDADRRQRAEARNLRGPVALTITVTPGTQPKKTALGGTVTVFVDGQQVAQAAVSAQAASVTLMGLARRSHEIVAVFTSDSVNDGGSTSRAVNVSIT